ncbi:MAG: ABC transporter permease, partial [bacterium]|nr:ABC transporter permease [bacterium]
TRHLRIPDQAVSIVALLGFAVPAFWLSQILILIFAVHLDWLPSLGMNALHSQPTTLGRLMDVSRHLLLPVAALAAGHLALMTRLVRSSMIETLDRDYIRTARAKGLSRRTVVFRHALRNALLPAITAAGYSVGLLLSTSSLVETVFGWPGMGRLLYDSLFRRDYPTLTGIFLVTSVLAIAANFAADVAYGRADPRTRG